MGDVSAKSEVSALLVSTPTGYIHGWMKIHAQSESTRAVIVRCYAAHVVTEE